MNAAAPRAQIGPLERTCLEIARVQRAAAFRRSRISRARQDVRHSDELLDLIEQCRLQDWRLVPSTVWSAVVRVVGDVDSDLRDELGINRDPEHVASVLFAAQEVLLMRARQQRQPALAPVIPLFGDRATAAEAS